MRLRITLPALVLALAAFLPAAPAHAMPSASGTVECTPGSSAKFRFWYELEPHSRPQGHHSHVISRMAAKNPCGRWARLVFQVAKATGKRPAAYSAVYVEPGARFDRPTNFEITRDGVMPDLTDDLSCLWWKDAWTVTKASGGKLEHC